MDWPAGQGVADQLLGPVDLRRVRVEEEEDTEGEPVLGLEVLGLVELEPLGFFLEKSLRNLAGQPGAVAGVAADAAAVFEGFDGDQGPFDHFGGRLPVFGGDAADAAGVFAHVVRVQELPRANQRQALVHRPFLLHRGRFEGSRPPRSSRGGDNRTIVIAEENYYKIRAEECAKKRPSERAPY